MLIKASLTLAVVGMALSGSPATARRSSHHHHAVHHRVSRPFARVFDGSVFGGDYYTNRDGYRVHRPVYRDHRPSGASARCRDGSWSFSMNHRGTCSHHGGVASWL